MDGVKKKDRVRLAKLYVLSNFLMGKQVGTGVELEHIRLLDDEDQFDNYPWGRLAYNSVYGLDLMPACVCFQLGNDDKFKQEGSVWMQQKDKNKQNMECLFYGNRRERVRQTIFKQQQ